MDLQSRSLFTGRKTPFSSPMSVRVHSPAARRGALLAGLNDAQQRAASFGIGVGDGAVSIGPLLIVAGAGSGKTLTLAARVARLVLAGADPTRILMLTFSRRAALEMERRVGRVLHEALGLASLQQAPRLAWCGTFHSVGARVLRGVAARIGLDESFTVDDRADSEDLIHLLRQRLGLASGARRFPQKGTCLAIYSRAVNARRPLADVLAETFPGAATTRTHCAACSPPTPKRSRRSVSSTSTTCSSGGPRRWPTRSSARRSRRASTTSSSTSTRTPTACRPRSSRACARTAATSPSSATTPRRSTRSAPPRCATSSTSPLPSCRRRRC